MGTADAGPSRSGERYECENAPTGGDEPADRSGGVIVGQLDQYRVLARRLVHPRRRECGSIDTYRDRQRSTDTLTDTSMMH